MNSPTVTPGGIRRNKFSELQGTRRRAHRYLEPRLLAADAGHGMPNACALLSLGRRTDDRNEMKSLDLIAMTKPARRFGSLLRDGVSRTALPTGVFDESDVEL